MKNRDEECAKTVVGGTRLWGDQTGIALTFPEGYNANNPMCALAGIGGALKGPGESVGIFKRGEDYHLAGSHAAGSGFTVAV